MAYSLEREITIAFAALDGDGMVAEAGLHGDGSRVGWGCLQLWGDIRVWVSEIVQLGQIVQGGCWPR